MTENKTARGRILSTGSIKDYIYKRKREEEIQGEGSKQEESETHRKNKVILRTPPRKESETNTDMDRLENLLVNMNTQLQEIKEDVKSTKDDIKTINDQMKSYGEEIRSLKEEIIKKEVDWEREKKDLRGEIETLKAKLESQEKISKKNNLVIKGINFGNLNLKQGINDFFQKEMGIVTMVEDAYKVGKPDTKVTIVRCSSFEQKLEILKQKQKLSKHTYIDSDLTRDEQKVQAAIRKIAREEKSKGKKTRIGYRKIQIDGVDYKWSDQKGGSLEKAEDSVPKN